MPLDLPQIGQAIVHPLLGYAVVTHTVTLDDLPIAVVMGPKGSSLVKAGQWRAATDADLPFWLRGADLPSLPIAPTSTLHQPSLFDEVGL